MRRGRHAALVAACAVSTAGPAASAAYAADHRPVRPLGQTQPLGDERLSGDHGVSRFAGTVTRSPVRSRPRGDARQVGRLHDLTEDGASEVYPVLESRRARGRLWLRVRLPMRPNGRSGWVPRESLGPLEALDTMLRVNRTTLRATLYRDDRVVWSSPIGVGKRATPTPAGRFWIRGRLRGLGGIYGPYAFGTAAYSVLSEWPGGGVIGIHGTDQPQLIPGRPSHGCIRVPNAAIRRLWRLMPVGTPVTVL